MWYLSFSFKPLLLQAVVGISAFLQRKTEVFLAQVRRQAETSGGDSLAARQKTTTQGVLLVPRAHPRQGGLSLHPPSPGRSLVPSSHPREAEVGAFLFCAHCSTHTDCAGTWASPRHAGPRAGCNCSLSEETIRERGVLRGEI